LEVLGLKIDSSEMQHVAKELATTHTGRRSVFKGNSFVDKLGQKVYTDLANYSDLRDPMNWGQVGLAEKDAEEQPSAESMLRHSHEAINEPLTKMDGVQEKERRDIEKNAVKNFKDLLRCMGDKPGAFTGDKAEPILKNIKKEGALRDEVYVQMMKQLTENPSTKSLQNGWELFQRLIREGLPNGELCEFLRGFLEKMAALQTEEVEKQEDGMPSSMRKSGRKKTMNKLEVTEARQKERSASRSDFMKNTLPLLVKSTLAIFVDVHGEK